MKVHPVTVEGFEGSLEDLAKLVCRMRYDKVEQFFSACAGELNRQACADARRKRVKLAAQLQKIALCMLGVELEMARAFHICMPYMQKELRRTPPFAG